jgi:membrane fusion protein, multidrug efflux system
MNKKKWWGMGAFGALLCLTAGLAWQPELIRTHLVSASTGTKAIDQPKPLGKARTVGVVYPSPVKDGTAITLPGRARASRNATLFFRVAGPLVHIHANPGDRVKKGSLLLELDDRDYQRQVKIMESKLASAQANLLKMKTGARPEDVRIIESSLSAARADLSLARKELGRYDILYKNQAVAEQAYDRAKTNVQSLAARVDALEQQLARDTIGARQEDITAARAGVEELRVRLDIARDQLNDTRLFAPFDGVVTQRMPQAHEMVRQGEPVMTLDDISRLEIPVAVPENQVGRFMERNPDIRYTALFLTHKNREFKASLSEFSSRADPATGTYEFVFTIAPDPEAFIFPGMTAEIKLSTGAGASDSLALAVPLQSLVGIAGNSAHVFIVNPETKTALRRAVTFETLARKTEVMVTAGLSRSDLVVAQGSAFIRQGEALTFENPEQQGAQ